jgi:hypothetical protein
MKNPMSHRAWVASLWLLAALPLSVCTFAEDVRVWKDRKGNSVEGAFLKEADGVVLIKRKDGQTVQAKMENLCEDDRTYVKDLTYVPREVVAVFKKHVYKDRFDEEVGVSEKATVRDTVVLRTVEGVPGAAAEPVGDTRWKVESVDNLGSRLLPRARDAGGEWVSEGCFLFVTYTVKNDTPQPVTVTHPVLSDAQGRRYVQSDKDNVAAFLPEGALFAGRDPIPTGGARLFCSIYEAARDSVPASLEVYPSKTSPHFVKRSVTMGKVIELDDAAEAAVSTRRDGG